MLKQKVESIMLPLSEYAVVDRDATLEQAIAELERFNADCAPNRHPHRAVLVRDREGRIIGKMGHLAFLRAILPERMAREDGEMLDRAGVSDDMMASSAGMFRLLGDEITNVCIQAKNIRVMDVCVPATASIDHGASWLDATRAFLTHQTLSMLVTDQGRTVGILRLADLFDELARLVKDDACG
jgi:CBS domain containing-hemolysin-like protein